MREFDDEPDHGRRVARRESRPTLHDDFAVLFGQFRFARSAHAEGELRGNGARKFDDIHRVDVARILNRKVEADAVAGRNAFKRHRTRFLIKRHRAGAAAEIDRRSVCTDRRAAVAAVGCIRPCVGDRDICFHFQFAGRERNVIVLTAGKDREGSADDERYAAYDRKDRKRDRRGSAPDMTFLHRLFSLFYFFLRNAAFKADCLFGQGRPRASADRRRHMPRKTAENILPFFMRRHPRRGSRSRCPERCL